MTIAVVGYVAYGCALLVRVDAIDDVVPLVAWSLALVAFWLIAQKRPLAVTLLLLGVLPLFGNHPGGRYMEAVNLPLAASAAGLVTAARRERRSAPDGAIRRVAGAYLLTAIVALVPLLPRIAVRAFRINNPILFAAEALSAAEDDVLYGLSSVALLTLAIVWGFAVTWSDAAERFAIRIYRALAIVLFIVTGVGLADYLGVTGIGRWYVRLVDPRVFHFVGLQSIFWHPGWFGWYFVVVFGLALGLWTIEPRERRWPLGVGLAIAYLSFFLNPERGGLLAVHVMLVLFASDVVRRAPDPRRASRRLVAAAVPVVTLILLALVTPPGRAALARANLLSIERTVNNAEEFLAHDPADSFRTSERLKLWSAATRMWRSAPIVGVGEGSFAWRFHEHVVPGSALDTPTFADAHSTWFQILATRGIVGVAAYLTLVLVVGRALWRRWQDRIGGSAVTPLVLAFAGFVTYSLVYQLFYLQPIQILFWLIVAVTAASTDDGRPTSRRFAWVATAAFVTALVTQLWTVRPLVAEARAIVAREPRGFYPVEIGPEGARKRWSSASGTLCLDPSAARVRFRFEAVDPRIATLPRTVTLSLDGAPLDRFEIATTDVVTRTLDLPAPHSGSISVGAFGECTRESRRLSVAISRTWSPADVGFNADPRHLGVLVFEPIDLRR